MQQRCVPSYGGIGGIGCYHISDNAVILHTTLDMMTSIRELVAEGRKITLRDLAVLSPYLTARIQLVGVYATDEVVLAPGPFDARLGFDLAAASWRHSRSMRHESVFWGYWVVSLA